MKKKIVDYIKLEVANEPLDVLDDAEDLLGSGIIDSIGMMKLIAFFEEEFKISVPPEEMTVENFMTVQSIADYLSRK